MLKIVGKIIVFLGLFSWFFLFIQKSASVLKEEKKRVIFKRQGVIKPLVVEVKKISDIKEITSKEVLAVRYTSVITLNKLPLKVKKKKFIELILPSILMTKYKVNALKKRVIFLKNNLNHTEEEDLFLKKLFKKYKTKDYKTLLSRLTTHPNSIVLAQAAVESGWGSSRFFLKANNIFGVWSFSSKDKRIPALSKRGEKTIYLKKYDSLDKSIEDYFRVLNESSSFKIFRKNRLVKSDPLELIEDLKYYSELREQYVKKLKRVIEYNNFTQYDDYQLSKKSFSY